jgi:hypothetical protein
MAITLLPLLLTNCPKPQKTTPLPPANEEKQPQFRSALGEVFLGTVQEVDLTGLPKKLFYPRARPTARYGKYERPRWGCSYNFETTDSPESVWDYYHKLLKNWKMVDGNEVKEWNYKFETYVTKDDKEVVQVNISRKNDKTIIVIAHTYNEL